MGWDPDIKKTDWEGLGEKRTVKIANVPRASRVSDFAGRYGFLTADKLTDLYQKKHNYQKNPGTRSIAFDVRGVTFPPSGGASVKELFHGKETTKAMGKLCAEYLMFERIKHQLVDGQHLVVNQEINPCSECLFRYSTLAKRMRCNICITFDDVYEGCPGAGIFFLSHVDRAIRYVEGRI